MDVSSLFLRDPVLKGSRVWAGFLGNKDAVVAINAEKRNKNGGEWWPGLCTRVQSGVSLLNSRPEKLKSFRIWDSIPRLHPKVIQLCTCLFQTCLDFCWKETQMQSRWFPLSLFLGGTWDSLGGTCWIMEGYPGEPGCPESTWTPPSSHPWRWKSSPWTQWKPSKEICDKTWAEHQCCWFPGDDLVQKESPHLFKNDWIRIKPLTASLGVDWAVIFWTRSGRNSLCSHNPLQLPFLPFQAACVAAVIAPNPWPKGLASS